MALANDVTDVGCSGSFTVLEQRVEGILVLLEDGREVFWRWKPTEALSPGSVEQAFHAIAVSTAPPCRAAELRLANDGCAYEREVFERWYPDQACRWDEAPVLTMCHSAPQGLSQAGINEALTQQVLAEVCPHFPGKEERDRRSSSSALEVGWTLNHSSMKAGSGQLEANEVEPLGNFPCLRQLVLEGMRLLGRDRPDFEHRLNVSCLWYSPGHGIQMHCDRPYCYQEEVYGAVVLNTSDRALEFQDVERLQRYVVPEVAGTCFAQRDKARFDWKHGILPLSRGERLSVTWRWFLPEVELRPRDGGAGRERGVDRTIPRWAQQQQRREPPAEPQHSAPPKSSSWEVYIDPVSERKWWWNSKTEEARFDPPPEN